MTEGITRVRQHGTARATVRKVRAGTWTKRRQQRFLAALSVTANVRASARAVRMSESGAYALRKSDPVFRDAWAAALAEGYATLELMMLERAMHGTIKVVTAASGKVSRTREYSERLALALLAAHRKSVEEERARHAPAAVSEAGRPGVQLFERFEAIRLRLMGGETVQADGADAADDAA